MKLPSFTLERYFAQYEFSTKYLLCSSDCESLAVKDLLALEPGAEERLRGLWLGYTESLGSPSLRETIAGIYTGIMPGQVLVHSGAEEAIFLFMNAVLQPGDHVIVQWPCYQSLSEVARAIGCDVTPWRLREEDGAWIADLDELRRALRPNTRVVVVNSPHNPTGYHFTQAEQAEVVELVEEHGALLFSDEVYRESEHDPAERLPAACDLSQRAVSLGVMSKTYGLAGLRIGWVATRNAEVFAQMAGMKDYTTICNSAPSELLAEIALKHREELAVRNVALIEENLKVLDGFFARQTGRFAWLRPRAGSVAFPRLVEGDIEVFCQRLVTEAGVLLLPGTLFDVPGGYFRLGFGRKNMPEALGVLEEYLGRSEFSTN
ncbi:MAG: aminotransferase class I/II-fold pyridoxal phosphate-dependent enzyme [Anaerolineaceae bacterium]|nr:aminotransferase class I/II-fold pyridoxal phosphate-dependent enzyme [Anaerolineaceae bacterium]